MALQTGNTVKKLLVAAENGLEKEVQILLEYGADVNAANSAGWTALHLAAQNGHLATARLLLTKEPDLDARAGRDGVPPLYQAALKGHDTLVNLLLENGANIYARNLTDGFTALHIAAEHGRESAVRVMLEHGVDVKIKVKGRWTALHLAAGNGHEGVVRLLLEKGADASARNIWGQKAQHAATNNGHVAVALLLNSRGRRAQCEAATNGHEAVTLPQESRTAMPTYVYTPLDNAGAQIRLLTISFNFSRYMEHKTDTPLNGILTHHYLPISGISSTRRMLRVAKIPSFIALSYMWGDPTRSHEIFIGGKRLLITANLHTALRQLNVNGLRRVRVWADAICINQEDLPERSAQLQLMCQVYHLAGEVRIWLGPGTQESWKCMNFIAQLTGSVQSQVSPLIAEESNSRKAPARMGAPGFLQKALTITLFGPPSFLLQVSGLGLDYLANILTLLGDMLISSGMDNKTPLVPTADENLSLHQEGIKELIAWRPTTKALGKAGSEGDSAGEIARLINRTLIQNPGWFSRMWVVQEAGTAHTVFLQYGGCTVPWVEFLRTIYYLHYACKSPVDDIRRVTGLEKVRNAWAKKMRQPLRDLIQECRHRRSTDPRDKIYALLGLMGDPMSDLLQPDYSKSVSEVYSNVTRYFIAQNNSLDPICGQQIQGRHGELPSWVPDFELDQDMAPSPLVNIGGQGGIFFASGGNKTSELSLPSISKERQPWSLLRVRGICIGKVGSISAIEPQDEHTSFSSIEKRWQDTLLRAGGLLGVTQETMSSLAEVSRVVRKYNEFGNSENTTGLQLEVTSSSKSPTGGSASIGNDIIVTNYVETLVCGRLSPSERLTDVMALLAGFTPPFKPDYIEKISTSLELGLRRRRLIITVAGSIGAAPEETQLSDLVCVLFGCSVPVVLRVKPNEDNYKFVGECYLHGFMDGEAVVGLEVGTNISQDFILK